MARYKINLAYDGTHYLGFQRQAVSTKIKTVQGEVERALSVLGWRERSILAAGRTDAGVHASGQVIAFDLDWRHSNKALQKALNSNLPMDIVVTAIDVVGADFHPRFDAIARVYQYRIYCRSVRDPFRDRFAWRVWPEVDRDLLQRSAKTILGEHDFRGFGTSPHIGGTTSRVVNLSRWVADMDDLVYEIEANAFLYHMVRRLVKIQVSIGQGKLDQASFHEFLDGDSRAMAEGLAPPQGLMLAEVIYA